MYIVTHRRHKFSQSQFRGITCEQKENWRVSWKVSARGKRRRWKFARLRCPLEHDLLNIVSGSHERFINGWPAEIHFPRVRPIRGGKPLEPLSPFSPRHTRGPFLRNPSVKISISTFHSLHSIPCRGSPGSLTLFSVWTRSSKMQQQSAELVERTSKQRTGYPCLDPRDARGDFLWASKSIPLPPPPSPIRSGKNIFGPVCVALFRFATSIAC